MKIRMLKRRNALKVGAIATIGDGVAEMWIRSGVAERMVPDPPAVDVTVEVNEQPATGRTCARRRKQRVTA